MKFKIGDHLQEINTPYHGYVTDTGELNSLLNTSAYNNHDETWYLLENDEMDLINHWVPESKLELHKQDLREIKLKELGI
jgi:hypothetical protein